MRHAPSSFPSKFHCYQLYIPAHLLAYSVQLNRAYPYTTAMAAPSEISCTNLSGMFVMVRRSARHNPARADQNQNKSLSDDVDAMLTLQGLSWWTRKAIRFATVVVR